MEEWITFLEKWISYLELTMPGQHSLAYARSEKFLTNATAGGSIPKTKDQKGHIWAATFRSFGIFPLLL